MESVGPEEQGTSVAWVAVLLCWRAGLWPEDASVSQPLKLRPEEVLCTHSILLSLMT